MPSIQITDVTPRTQIIATASQTVFNIPFVFFALTDIVVYQTPVGTTPSDATNILSPSVYTVATNVSYTGTVTLNSGATSGDIITIVRAMPDQRLNLYLPGNALSSVMLNTDSESLVLITQQNKMYNQTIAPRYNLTAQTVTADWILPQLTAGQTWSKNAGNTAIVGITVPPQPVGAATTGYGTDKHVVRWDGTGVAVVQDSAVTISDSGVITGGSWQGTVVDIPYGGTNASTASGARTNLGLAIGTNVQAWSATLDTVSAGTYTGSTSITTLGTISAGLIPIANGGTGQTSKTAAFNALSPNTTKGDITVFNGTNNVRLGVGTDGYILSASSGSGTGLSWIAGTTGSVTDVIGTTNRITSSGGATPTIDISASYVGQASLTTLGTITSGVWNGTGVTVPYGGTGNSTFTAYSVMCAGTTSTGSFQNVVGVGTSGQVLTSNGAAALPTWQAGGGGSGSSLTSAIVQVTHGFSVGNAIIYNGSAYALAQGDSAANAESLGIVSVVTDANDFTVTTGGYISGLSGLTAGSVHFLDPATPGALTAVAPSTPGQVSKPVLIADSTSSGFIFNMRGEVIPDATTVSVTGTSATMSAGKVYVANNVALVTLTMPASAAVGDTFSISGQGSGGWLIQANTGQIINLGNLPTSTAGYLASTNRYDAVSIRCTVANTTFTTFGTQGNITAA